MAYGLAVYDSDGTEILSSPTGIVHYYDGTTAVQSSQATLGSSGYDNVRATVSADSQYYSAAYTVGALYFFNKNTNTQWTFAYLRSAGVVSNGVYYPPSKYLTSVGSSGLNRTILNNGMHVYSTPSTAYSFGQRQDGGTGFGLVTSNDSNYLVIDTEHKPMYIQPKSDGSTIRTVSAESEGLKDDYYNIYTMYGGAKSLTLSQKPATITFEKAYNNPPLVFLADSGGTPVAIYGFIQDSEGKYTGVTLTTGVDMIGLQSYRIEFKNTTQMSSSIWRCGSSVNTNIDVMIVSDEIPDYVSSDLVGLQTFDSSSNVLFDSRYSAVGFGAQNVTMPYMYVQGQFSTFSSYAYHDYDHHITSDQSFNMTGLRNAVCLNSFTPWSGIVSVTARGDNSRTYYCTNFYGRYASVDKDTDTTITVSAKGSGTIGESQESRIDLKSGIWPYSSVDAHIGQTSTMDVITLSW